MEIRYIIILYSTFYLCTIDGKNDECYLVLIPIRSHDSLKSTYGCGSGSSGFRIIDEESMDMINQTIYNYKFKNRYWNGFEGKGDGSYSMEVTRMVFSDETEINPDDYTLWDDKPDWNNGKCGWFQGEEYLLKTSQCNHKDYKAPFVCQKDPVDGECDTEHDFHKYDSFCLSYQLLEFGNEKKVDAENRCNSNGRKAHLATVKDEDDHRRFYDEIRHGTFLLVWTDAILKDGEWQNSDGSKIPASAWAPGEPSEGKCGFIAGRKDFKLVSKSCDVVTFALCEKEGARKKKTTTTSTTTTTTKAPTTTKSKLFNLFIIQILSSDSSKVHINN
ncbi:uncharacterized protein LOC111625248 [Centruroides sculpturatus]|uniref:uncharacterized protein LOC111625248 n=1 Tax=Centruroides sculpturatus TaxID=218467 RepID=UPI000C6DB18C|nr:uncharacterized protein LOC111625248 [Centruroides sculpturatus]